MTRFFVLQKYFFEENKSSKEKVLFLLLLTKKLNFVFNDESNTYPIFSVKFMNYHFFRSKGKMIFFDIFCGIQTVNIISDSNKRKTPFLKIMFLIEKKW